MFNPIAWYLDLNASWGLIPEDWQIVASAPMVIGLIAGIFAIGAMVAGLVCSDFIWDLSDSFNDNVLTRVGYRISVTFLSLAAVALAGVLGFCATTTIVGLLAKEPLLTLIGLLVLGPLLMLAGKIKWRKPNLSLRRKQEATTQIPSHDSYEEALKHHGLSDEDFYDLDLGGGVTVPMPK